MELAAAAGQKKRRELSPPETGDGSLPKIAPRLLDRTVEVMLQLFLVLSLLLEEEEDGNGGSRQCGDCGEYGDEYGESILFQIRHLRRNQCKTSRGSGTATFPGSTRCFLTL